MKLLVSVSVVNIEPLSNKTSVLLRLPNSNYKDIVHGNYDPEAINTHPWGVIIHMNPTLSKNWQTFITTRYRDRASDYVPEKLEFGQCLREFLNDQESLNTEYFVEAVLAYAKYFEVPENAKRLIRTIEKYKSKRHLASYRLTKQDFTRLVSLKSINSIVTFMLSKVGLAFKGSK